MLNGPIIDHFSWSLNFGWRAKNWVENNLLVRTMKMILARSESELTAVTLEWINGFLIHNFGNKIQLKIKLNFDSWNISLYPNCGQPEIKRSQYSLTTLNQVYHQQILEHHLFVVVHARSFNNGGMIKGTICAPKNRKISKILEHNWR